MPTLEEAIRSAFATPRRYGRWVTIGAKKSTEGTADGLRDASRGGTPVFISDDGKIEKGPASLVDQNVGDIKKPGEKKDAPADDKPKASEKPEPPSKEAPKPPEKPPEPPKADHQEFPGGKKTTDLRHHAPDYDNPGIYRGDIIKNPDAGKPGQPEFVRITKVESNYHKNDGLSFGVGAEEGWSHNSTARPATPEEAEWGRAANAPTADHEKATAAAKSFANKAFGEGKPIDKLPAGSKFLFKDKTWDRDVYATPSNASIVVQKPMGDWNNEENREVPYDAAAVENFRIAGGKPGEKPPLPPMPEGGPVGVASLPPRKPKPSPARKPAAAKPAPKAAPPASKATAKATGSFTKLKDGSWGLRVNGTAKKGDAVKVTKKDGTTDYKTIREVVFSKDGVTVAKFSGEGPRIRYTLAEAVWGAMVQYSRQHQPQPVRYTLAQAIGGALSHYARQRSLFDEDDHPRDEDGKFTSGDGGSSGSSADDEPKAERSPSPADDDEPGFADDDTDDFAADGDSDEGRPRVPDEDRPRDDLPKPGEKASRAVDWYKNFESDIRDWKKKLVAPRTRKEFKAVARELLAAAKARAVQIGESVRADVDSARAAWKSGEISTGSRELDREIYLLSQGGAAGSVGRETRDNLLEGARDLISEVENAIFSGSHADLHEVQRFNNQWDPQSYFAEPFGYEKFSEYVIPENYLSEALFGKLERTRPEMRQKLVQNTIDAVRKTADRFGLEWDDTDVWDDMATSFPDDLQPPEPKQYARERLIRATVRRYASKYGRWVTMGAKDKTLGTRHGLEDGKVGGSKVYISDDGRIEKGAAGLVGKKVDQLGNDKAKTAPGKSNRFDPERDDPSPSKRLDDSLGKTRRTAGEQIEKELNRGDRGRGGRDSFRGEEIVGRGSPRRFSLETAIMGAIREFSRRRRISV